MILLINRLRVKSKVVQGPIQINVASLIFRRIVDFPSYLCSNKKIHAIFAHRMMRNRMTRNRT